MKPATCKDCELPARKGNQCLHHYYKDWKARRRPVEQGEPDEQ